MFFLDKTGEHEECSSLFCDLIATNFNFTSSICRLLVGGANKTRADSDPIDKNVKIAFSILNELTANNRLLIVDNSVKQLIYDIIDRM